MNHNEPVPGNLLPPRALLLALLVLFVALGCNFTGVTRNMDPIAPSVPPPPTATNTTIPASTSPELLPGTETVHPVVSVDPSKVTYWFEETDCACMNIPAQSKANYGPGVLECNTAWSGTFIDDNSTFLRIVQYDSADDLDRDFNENLGWMQDTIRTEEAFIASESPQKRELFFAIQEPNGLLYVVTGPGGGSSKTNTEIPMCGNGSGVMRVDSKFLVKIRLFACDLGDDHELYRAAIETLGACALTSIARAVAAGP